MKLILAKNSTSVSVTVFIQDPDSASGGGLENLTWDSIKAAYYKSGSPVYSEITLQSATLGEWVSGGFVEVEQGNPNPSGVALMPGLYQLSLPDEVLSDDTSTLVDNSVVVMLTSDTTTIVPCILEIQLLDHAFEDANVIEVLGEPVVGGFPEVDVVQWDGSDVSTPSVAGVPKTDIAYINGVAAATTDIVDANVTEVNGVGVTVSTIANANVLEWNSVPLTDHDFPGVEANVINWNYDDVPVHNFGETMPTVVLGTATAATLTSTQMSTNLPSSEEDYYNDRVIIWTSGDLNTVARVITNYVGATKTVTYLITPGTPAGNLVPAAGDTFVVI